MGRSRRLHCNLSPWRHLADVEKPYVWPLLLAALYYARAQGLRVAISAGFPAQY